MMTVGRWQPADGMANPCGSLFTEDGSSERCLNSRQLVHMYSRVKLEVSVRVEGSEEGSSGRRRKCSKQERPEGYGARWLAMEDEEPRPRTKLRAQNFLKPG
jgi:hypothetical protein